MGMFTELYISSKLKEDTPKDIQDVVIWLFEDRSTEVRRVPDHPFFKTSRWAQIGGGSSYYFTPFETSRAVYDRVTKSVYFTSRSDLKNYDDEIGQFLDWITPYLDLETGEHIGHVRYEEDEKPTLIYMR